MSSLLRTPLYEQHRQLGARLVEFAGFEMPIQYGSILEEHTAVRERAGLFDVSHMGQIHLEGPGAEAAVERLLTCPVASLLPGRVRYGCLCNERGGVVDDVTVYRTGEHAFFLCVNAANIEKDEAWVRQHCDPRVQVSNRSSKTGLLALQGPRSPGLLQSLCDLDLAGLRRFRFARAKVADCAVLVSHTGYTGSDGFELYIAAEDLTRVFTALLEAGRGVGLLPAGLGARDTLRLEAALPLYGHELDDTTSPLEARLDRFVKLEEGGFIGAEAILERRAAGHPRLLVGFVLEERGIPRTGYGISVDGRELGSVTSGGPSPTLGKSIGLGYVPPGFSALDSRLEVMIRGRGVAARVVETPFVGRGGSAPPATG